MAGKPAKTPVVVPIKIPVRGKEILLKEDSTPLFPYQIKIIKRKSRSKTEGQWLSAAKGIKIPLTKDQRKEVVLVKDSIINILDSTRDPKRLLMVKRGFGFTDHAVERVLTRIERLSEEELELLGPNYKFSINQETLEKITQSLIDSKEVNQFAEWKGHPYLNFGLNCKYDDRDVDIIVNFAIGILIVTMIVVKETGYAVQNIYSFDGKTFTKKTFTND
ncbi:hypothetical protein [Halalkalibacter lacteus]|uniref:hypothetical protein n=1 Tax=Halalkalibacter lacteus TaxID=3090663 RepID=UPI002FC5D080